MKKIVLFFVCIIPLLISCTDEKDPGIRKYDGWYRGWAIAYIYADSTANYVPKPGGLDNWAVFHFGYDSASNCLYWDTEDEKGYHLIVQPDGRFVSKEKESFTVHMPDSARQVVVKGRFTKENGVDHVDLYIMTSARNKSYDHMWGNRTKSPNYWENK
ncbi:MAG: hypothetical protein K5650_03520 [Bacteroidales bacterium]|nr:hypothetical protein [Bacteroidales bacterium]